MKLGIFSIYILLKVNCSTVSKLQFKNNIYEYEDDHVIYCELSHEKNGRWINMDLENSAIFSKYDF